MLHALNTESNMTRTENGAATLRTTGSACLDLFATVGALRGASRQDILTRFIRAWGEDRDLAMKLLFYARDVRQGLGERKVFRTMLSWLADNYPESVRKNIEHIAEYGRWDDLLILLDTRCALDALALIRRQLNGDLAALERGERVSLLGKWLPSVNTSSDRAVRSAKRIARYLGMTDAVYRKTLSKLRAHIGILENSLREKDYTFDYEAQPSRAMFCYRKAFLRNDNFRYEDYLARVRRGEAKLHTDTLAPYDIVAPCFGFGRTLPDAAERAAMDATWNALPDFTGGENALVVADGSGSMYTTDSPSPAAVAMSLAVYFAERNTGVFQNCFITFSERPRLVKIHGADIAEKIQYCQSFDEVANTNIRRVFELVLKAAVKHRVPASQMPARLYIISDMEFDDCADGAEVTNFQYAKALYARFGYALPQIVFWNVASRNRHQPVRGSEQGVALVSGASPRLFRLLSDGCLNPWDAMMDILGSDRYAAIRA